MCSTGGADLAQICQAIEDLAKRAGHGGEEDDEAGDAARLARLAAIWAMVAEADPELAKRLPGYLTASECRRPAARDGARPAGRQNSVGSGSGDHDFQGGGHLGVQPDRHLVRADGLDRVLDLDPAPVQLRPARPLDRGGDVRC